MKNCINCIWHYACICVVCEEDNMVVCELQHKHVFKTDSCDRFAEINNEGDKDMNIISWRDKKFNELTMEDGLMAALEGFCFECKNGKVTGIRKEL